MKFQLYDRICKLSVSSDWSKAKLEWIIYYIDYSLTPHTCLCGHFPILELCHIKNKMNGAETTVGNCCIKKFGVPKLNILNSLKKIALDSHKSVSIDTIVLSQEEGVINEWEANFYMNIARLRKLSEKRLDKKLEINKKLLNRYWKGI